MINYFELGFLIVFCVFIVIIIFIAIAGAMGKLDRLTNKEKRSFVVFFNLFFTVLVCLCLSDLPRIIIETILKHLQE